MYKPMVVLETVKREYESLIATRREYPNLLNRVQQNKDAKVEKLRTGTFGVRVTCEEGGDKLVSILEAFDEMCFNAQQARVSCNNDFCLEAIAVAEEQTLHARDVTESLLKAIGKQSGENDSAKLEN